MRDGVDEPDGRERSADDRADARHEVVPALARRAHGDGHGAQVVGELRLGHVELETSSIAGFRRRAWSKLIRQMLLSDVNIIHRGSNLNPGFEEEDVVGSQVPPDLDVVGSFHRTDIVFERRPQPRGRVRLVVYYHERLSSEIKDEICSKLASALRAGGFLNLKSKLHLDFTNVPHAVH